MQRIFIAVKVKQSDEFKSYVNSLKRGTVKEKIKWVEPSNMHVTLFFLGNTEKDALKEIKKSLREKYKGFLQFSLTIRGFGVFKSINDPRVIWAGLDTSEELNSLQKLTITGLREAGLTIDDHKYAPHVTLGRIKKLENPESVAVFIEKYRVVEFQKIFVDEVIIYESILSSTGPTYKPLANITLQPLKPGATE